MHTPFMQMGRRRAHHMAVRALFLALLLVPPLWHIEVQADADPVSLRLQATLATASVLPDPTRTREGSTMLPTSTEPVVPPPNHPSGTNTPLVPSPTARVAPDRFEPNNSYATAAAIPLAQALGKLSLPRDDVDFYRVSFTAAQSGQPYTVTVTTGYGLLVSLVVFRDTDQVAVAQTDPHRPQLTQSLTWTAQPGSYTIQVADAGSDNADDRLYQLGLGQIAASSPTPAPTTSSGWVAGSDPDENNYDLAHAARIDINHLVTANFVCPDPQGCGAGGDQDFYSFVAKPGVCYTIEVTQEAVDLNAILLDAAGHVLMGNDDRSPGDQRPLLDWCVRGSTAQWVVLLLGPVGTLTPADAAQPYQFHITPHAPPVPTPRPTSRPAEPPLPRTSPPTPPSPTRVLPRPASPTVTSAAPVPPRPSPTRLTVPPTPVPLPVVAPLAPVVPAPVPAPVADVPLLTDGPVGLAVIIADTTMLRVAPDPQAEEVQPLGKDRQVKLLGTGKGVWVRVQPLDTVIPGWMMAHDLRPLSGTIPLAAPGIPVPTPTGTLLAPPPFMGTTNASTTPLPTATPGHAAATPAPSAAERPDVQSAMTIAAPTPAPHLSVDLTINVTQALPGSSGPPVPQGAGIAGIRVQLVNVFGDVLAEATTGPDGRVEWTRDLLPDLAVYVQVPAAGLRAQVDPTELAAGKATLVFALPLQP